MNHMIAYNDPFSLLYQTVPLETFSLVRLQKNINKITMLGSDLLMNGCKIFSIGTYLSKVDLKHSI